MVTRYNWMSDDEVLKEARFTLSAHGGLAHPALIEVTEELIQRFAHALEFEEKLDDYITLLESASIGLKRCADGDRCHGDDT
ncbi:MAG: hypothetical protein EOM24_10460 [Chloroflexia bacterium]|nr:hypothetical protein [Chloroflexia bacterium]